jgi:VanZ family protein
MSIINWFEKHSSASWLITIIIASTIFYLSSKTFQGTSTTSNLSIIYHFFAFFFLAAFLLISLIKGKISNPLLFVFGIGLAIIYGISDEIHQYFVPGRHFSLFDILTNSTGILTASTIYCARCLRDN